MKTLLIFLSILLFQDPKPKMDFEKFRYFVIHKYKTPPSLKADCNWRYAYVKLKVNGANKVIDYNTLNDVSDTLKNSLAYLKGYQFPRDMPIKQKPIVFMFIQDNLREDCKIPRSVVHTPTEMANMLLFYLGEQVKKEPQTIVLYQPILTTLQGPQK
jgi:hypothetical protein